MFRRIVTWLVVLILLALLAGSVYVAYIQRGGEGSVYSSPRQTITCRFGAETRRASLDIDVAISGRHRSAVWVDVYAPGSSEPLPVMDQFSKTFADTGDPYIHQAYSVLDATESGRYRILARYRGEDYTWYAQVDPGEALTVQVDCG